MLDVLELLVPWFVTTTAIFALLRWDDGRMSPDDLARAWPQTSKVCAVIGFSFLAVPIHFARTRPNLRGVGLALLWTAAILALNVGTAALIDLLGGG